jgi:hypothetical protein
MEQPQHRPSSRPPAAQKKSRLGRTIERFSQKGKTFIRQSPKPLFAVLVWTIPALFLAQIVVLAVMQPMPFNILESRSWHLLGVAYDRGMNIPLKLPTALLACMFVWGIGAVLSWKFGWKKAAPLYNALLQALSFPFRLLWRLKSSRQSA